MNDENRLLLEQILTANVLLLSAQMHAEKKAGGTNRAFGDYTKDAAKLIHEKRPQILELLR